MGLPALKLSAGFSRLFLSVLSRVSNFSSAFWSRDGFAVVDAALIFFVRGDRTQGWLWRRKREAWYHRREAVAWWRYLQ